MNNAQPNVDVTTHWHFTVYYEDTLGAQFQINGNIELIEKDEKWQRAYQNPPLTRIPNDLYEGNAWPLLTSAPVELPTRTDSIRRLDEELEQLANHPKP